MANNVQKKAIHVMGLVCVLLFVQNVQAREYIVGNSKWSVRSNSTESYNQWAERNRFQIGDTLVFDYSQDSVLQVKKADYDSCNTDAPIVKYTDGHTVITLDHSGPSYFISGTKDNCLNGEKLVVVVMADRTNSYSKTNATAPATPPAASPPPPAAVPAPAPTGESPPAGTVEINPTPAPTQQQSPPPPNAASSSFISVAGSIGAFLASSLILSF